MSHLFNLDALNHMEEEFRQSEEKNPADLMAKIESIQLLRKLNSGEIHGVQSEQGLCRLSGIFPIEALNTNYVRAASLAFSQIGYKDEHALVLHIEYEYLDGYWVFGLRYQTSTFYYADLRNEIGCSLAFARAFPPRHIGSSPRFDLISQPIAIERGFKLKTLLESLLKNLKDEQVTNFDHFVSPNEWDGFFGFMQRTKNAINETAKEMSNETRS